MKRDKNQRTAYGLARMSLAVDRGIRAWSSQEKAQSRVWVLVWAKVAKLPVPAMWSASPEPVGNEGLKPYSESASRNDRKTA